MDQDQDKVLKIAEQFQDECHAAVSMNEQNVSYQDATNVWMFKKLAELQHEINILNKNQRGKGVKGGN